MNKSITVTSFFVQPSRANLRGMTAPANANDGMAAPSHMVDSAVATNGIMKMDHEKLMKKPQ